MTDTKTATSKAEIDNAVEEHRYHHYEGSTIPWFIHLLWLLFWVFTVIYLIRYQLPALQIELISPP